MKAKLIKHIEPDFFFITNEDGSTFATTDDWYFKNTKGCFKLSLKNCQTIELGYDIDKLRDKSATEWWSEPNRFNLTNELIRTQGFFEGFDYGFNKVIELNKDKIFTLNDIRNAVYTGVKIGRGTPLVVPATDEYIQSLNITEWNVIVCMETCSLNPSVLDCSEIIERPKLDGNDCLILKKI